jgi:hypothetical protein
VSPPYPRESRPSVVCRNSIMHSPMEATRVMLEFGGC